MFRLISIEDWELDSLNARTDWGDGAFYGDGSGDGNLLGSSLFGLAKYDHGGLVGVGCGEVQKLWGYGDHTGNGGFGRGHS